MSTNVTLEEARARLEELVGSLAPGDEVVLTLDEHPVAKLVPIAEGERTSWPCEPGSAKPVDQPPPKSRLRPPPGLGKGMIAIVSDDDDHLKDFAEYMP